MLLLALCSDPAALGSWTSQASALCLSDAIPSTRQALPTLLGLAHSQSFFRCLPEPLGGAALFWASPWVFPVARAASNPDHSLEGDARQWGIVGGLLGAENQHGGVTVFSCCWLESETGHPKSEKEGSHEHHPSPYHAPVILPTRWATFSAHLCFSREKFLTFGDRVGTFQMGPRLPWSQGLWSLDLCVCFIHVATDVSLPSLPK